MGIRIWILGKGLAGSIANDLLKKYLVLKNKYPYEEEKLILERVWNIWITLNEEPIRREDSEDKVIRLETVKDRSDNSSFHKIILFKSLIQLYEDVLYIEANILPTDGKLYKNCLKVFLDKADKLGLDFKNEYDNYVRTMNILGM